MRLIVAGSRSINKIKLVYSSIDRFREFNNVTSIISGGASGVDSLAHHYACCHKIPFTLFPANFRELGKSAGPIRNQKMVDEADALLLIWDGVSRGSSDILRRAKKKGIFVKEIIINALDRK